MYESSCNFTGDDVIAPFIAQIECPAQWVFFYMRQITANAESTGPRCECNFRTKLRTVS